ncbi:transcription initiation factor TFIID subunit beta [Coccidioides immitis RS]|uniref:Transcription initiation factor TFIID subunit beta n=4 Tax=Coccidioides immitis TaxID=5501 RepID=A0A0E1S1Z5_COCIM|nr:transcription initiation factor TFIID subunit beta [Coccidioides immitis RS]KMP03708.1 transcription factor TFIID complex subunit Taf11 [Coccidioides immitis RMSCC 2394]KMU74682.1 hypothetical protein CISG_00612 [Coccidioides immitis RMSCC 3703]KMU83205.1 transcription factor TFIID complex subunit Taf11 [Coccidioides immitis H538.4]TPX23952.1 hypothetical protein DIZ76_013295 [Coccidioides immitis]EAS31101.1 transcription initiation factor TFIID subunit beta [Coccidioides immitis RS]
MSLSPPPTTLSLPASNSKKRPSLSSAVSSSSSQPSKKPRLHPLRQTSFPTSADTDPRVYAGATSARSEIDGASVTGSFTGSLTGSVDGVGAGRGRRKKGKKDRDDASGSVRAGTVDGKGAGSAKGGVGDEEGEEDDDDDLGDTELMERDDVAVDAEAEKKNLAILIDAFNPEQSERYDLFKRAKLNKPTLRKIVNQTLSQSVPPNVITTISGYTKIFIGEMVEKARTVQQQWADTTDAAALEAYEAEEEELTIQEESQAAEQVSDPSGQEKPKPTTSLPSPSIVKVEGPKEPVIKKEESQSFDGISVSTPPNSTQTTLQSTMSFDMSPATTATTVTTAPGETRHAGRRRPFKLPPNPHRGPLLPSHLREAFRRYRRDGEGGGVGFTGLSMNGLSVRGAFTWSVRSGSGGRRLFR